MADTANYIKERVQRLIHGMGERYEPYVRQHLAKVYMVFASTIAAAAGGALVQMDGISDLGMLAEVISVVLGVSVHLYKSNAKNYYIRLGMLFAFGFFSGQTLGPILSYIVRINPEIILTILTGTFATFGSLSLAALLAEDGKYLYLGGILFSIIHCITLLNFLNIIFNSSLILVTQLYVGLFVILAFVLYDTQYIVEKCRMGDLDVVGHTLDLFFHALCLFRRVVIILTQKEKQKLKDLRKRK